MGREARGRRRAGRGRAGRVGGWRNARLLWVCGVALLVGALLLPAFGPGGGAHPAPREHVGHDHVAPGERYAAYPRVARTYAMVAEIPHVIDGIYCYCACSEHSGHYSLLDCFHDDHGARCDVCLSEADLAYRMHRDGASLEAIRVAVDRLYDT